MPPPSNLRSSPGIDIHRGIAVILMFLAHAWRMQSSSTSANPFLWIDRTLRELDRGVAYVAASFLFLAGYSLVLARNSSTQSNFCFFLGILRRSGWLYLIAILMFIAEHGTDLPDLAASPGILSMIAVALVITSAGILCPRPILALASISITVVTATFILESLGYAVSGLNSGPGGAIPLIAYSTLGAICAILQMGQRTRSLMVIAAASFPVFIFALLSSSSWLALYPSTYSYHGGLAIASLLGFGANHSGHIVRVFWNPSTIGTIGLVFPVLLTTTVLVSLERIPLMLRLCRPVLKLGRHSLLAFLAHYALLGSAELCQFKPSHGGWTLSMTLILTLTCWGAAEIFDRIRRRCADRSTH